MRWITVISAFYCALLPMVAPDAAQAANLVTVEQALAYDPGHPPIPVAIWAPIAGEGLSLVVMSHGTGGGMTSHVDTAQALAEAGFVVVAPMHPGDNFEDDSIVGRADWFVDRSRHISKVIDYMIDQWPGHARLGSASVGVFGFSAGGATTLISAGGALDLNRIGPHCSQQPEFVCDILGSSAMDAGEQLPQWTHDPRIAAAVIAAPGLGFAFEPASLSQIQVPVQLWVGSEDETVPYGTNAGVIKSLLPHEPDFYRVAGANHLSFLAPCTPQTPPMLCRDLLGFDRTSFHQDFNQALIAFLTQHLGNSRQ